MASLDYILSFVLFFVLNILLIDKLTITDASDDDDDKDRFITARELSMVGEELSNKLLKMNDEYTRISVLQKSYSDAMTAGALELNDLKGGEIADKLASELGKLFSTKTEALKASVKFAEELTEQYKWDSQLKEVDYIMAKCYEDMLDKCFNYSDPAVIFSDMFNSEIHPYNSSVHIPVDIYEGDVDILNTLSWTSRLDEVWRSNQDTYKNLRWQYFGAQTGVLRNFPGAAWKGLSDYGVHEVDLYDVRRRPWYSQGASSPKDMLILVDRSGSSHGQALALIKHSIKSIIDTLNENDFVNVAQFSEEAEWVSCFDTLVQANHRNKRILKSDVDDITANGVAHYDKGLTFAFEQLDKFDRTENLTEGEGAMCNKVLMFLTDGGTDNAEEVFKKYNADKRVRVFTYAVGPIANPSGAIKWIGCSNRGYFYLIPAMGAIRATVQEHMTILAGPLATASSTAWTPVYRGELGLGLITSITSPVFNRSIEGNDTIVGVIGLDVPLSELQALIPMDKLGQRGYAFAINHNGYLLFHPNIKTEDYELSDPPSVDLLDVEEESSFMLKIRKDMIDQKSGQQTFTLSTRSLDGHHTDYMKKTYWYRPIPNSPFSVAVVLPEAVKNFAMTKKQFTIDDGIEVLNNVVGDLYFDSSAACIQDIEPVSNISTPLEDFIEFIRVNGSQCNEDLLQKLFFDTEVTNSVTKQWMSDIESEFTGITSDASRDGVVSFVSTNNDISRAASLNSTASFGNISVSPSTQAFYRRAVNNPDIWIYSPLTLPDGSIGPENFTEKVIQVSKSVVLAGTKLAAAVIGIHMPQSRFKDILIEALPVCKAFKVRCYMIDDGGVILYSTEEYERGHELGSFFGSVEPLLMEALLEDSFFINRTRYDFQGVCADDKGSSSSGIKILPSLLLDLLSFNWWTKASSWMAAVYSTFSSSLFATSRATEEEEDGTADGLKGDDIDPESYMNMMLRNYISKPKRHSCVKAYYTYSLKSRALMASATAKSSSKDGAIYSPCTNCSRSFAVSIVPKTNLAVVIVSTECDLVACTRLPKFSFDSLEVDDPVVEGDNCTSLVRYRRRPLCFDRVHGINITLESYCGSESTLLLAGPSFRALTCACLTLFFVTFTRFSYSTDRR